MSDPLATRQDVREGRLGWSREAMYALQVRPRYWRARWRGREPPHEHVTSRPTRLWWSHGDSVPETGENAPGARSTRSVKPWSRMPDGFALRGGRAADDRSPAPPSGRRGESGDGDPWCRNDVPIPAAQRISRLASTIRWHVRGWGNSRRAGGSTVTPPKSGGIASMRVPTGRSSTA